ncbi:flagellar hook-length control protein FliK [Spongiibacter sp. KMU-158]|uniref:Flagellar hook-length control protein FliK n=1 Tax=Spongiibacter pelagi TaxID=2760804 RepID=A0A927GW03_9GAMM|nr:flagellar hook-length control protein FliK [Spongiibacter pelagi]MBD2858437.1 flagellar hook-length control protein FliK [Spongiibacter pelagi]
MTGSINAHQGLKDALDIFSSLSGNSGVGKLAAGQESAMPFNELLAARQISLLDSEAPGFQHLTGNALAKLSAQLEGQDSSLIESKLVDPKLLTQLSSELESSEEDLLGEESDAAENLAVATLGGLLGMGANALPEVKRLSPDQLMQASALERLSTSGFTLAGNSQHGQFGDMANSAGEGDDSADQSLLKSLGGKVEGGVFGFEKLPNELQTKTAAGLASGLGDSAANSTVKMDAAVGDFSQLLDDQQNSLTAIRDRVGGLTETKALPQFTISENALNDPAWDKAISARLNWMGSQGVGSAVLRLNPQELGHIQIDLKMDGSQANVQFHAESADTSEMIERLMPRLHSAFESQGIKLDQVKVNHQPDFASAGFQSSQDNAAQAQAQSQQQSQRQSQEQQSGAGGRGQAAGANGTELGDTSRQLDIQLKPGVDYYA